MRFNHNHLLLLKYSIFIFVVFIIHNYCFLDCAILSGSYYFLSNYSLPLPVSMEHSFILILFLFLMSTTLVNYSIEIRSLNSSLVASSSINFNQGMTKVRNKPNNSVYLTLVMIMEPTPQTHSFFT